MSNDYQLGLALLHKFSYVIQTELQDGRLVFLVLLGISLSTSLGLSFLLKSGLLVFFSFWAVLCK